MQQHMLCVWCRSTEETVQHSNGWLTQYYRLPSHLPDYAHLTLRSIEVAAVAPADAAAAITPAHTCLGYVGMYHITYVVSYSCAPMLWDNCSCHEARLKALLFGSSAYSRPSHQLLFCHA